MSRPLRSATRLLLVGASVAALLTPDWVSAQQPATAPAATAAAPTVAVRGGVHPDHTRLVFDWSREVPFNVEQSGSAVTIRFSAPASFDLTRVGGNRLKRVGSLGQTASGDGVSVRFDIPSGAGVKPGRVGTKVYIDVLDKAPDTPAAAAKPAAAEAAKSEPAKKAADAATKPADPRPAKEGAPLFELRGHPAAGAPAGGDAKAAAPTAAAAATGAPTPLAPAAEPAKKPAPITAAAAPAPATAAAHGAAKPVPAPAAAQAAPAATAADAATQPDAMAPVAVTFDPKVARSAALFERAGYLYLLFDDAVPPETPVPSADLHTPIEPLTVDGGSGFRFAMPALMEASIRREGTAWKVMLQRPADITSHSDEGSGLLPHPDPDFALGARLVVPMTDAEKVLTFKDPIVGDVLSVVPVPVPGPHVPVPLRYVELQVLPSLLGLVVRPLDDGLLVQPVREGVEISVPGGLRLSPAADADVATPPPPPPVEKEKLYDFKRWGQVAAKDYIGKRQEKWNELIGLPETERTRGRLNIARFYLANGLAYEALGMLTRVQGLQPDVDRRPEFLAVRGVARVLTGDYPGGLADLSNRQLASEPDATLWRAAALAGQQDFAGAHAAFQANKELLDHYPEPFYKGLALTAVESALNAGQPEAAALIMDRIVKRGGEEGEDAAAVQYFRGAVFRALGDNEKALSYFEKARGGRDRLYAMRGKRDAIDTALAMGKLDPKEAAKQMETLRFAWRGDALELSNLRRIGEVHALAGNYPQAFDSMRQTISAFPDTKDAKEIAADMTRTFTDLFGTDGAAKMPPLEALALYEQYRELTPPGPDGDRIIRKLAERLVEIDLLDRAAELLDHQVQYRLTGAEKAQVGTRLAGIRLLDGKPELALAALDKSVVEEITPELAEERQLLRARALSQMGKGPDAVQLLATDQSRNANLLRIDIAMRDKQWPAAAQALADVIGPPPAAGATLDPQVAGLVVNRAIALSLARDNAGLDALRRDFGKAMEASKDATTFQLLTRPEEAAGLADAATIRSRMSEIDLFRSFLDNYRTARQETTSPPPAAAATGPTQPPS